MLSASFDPGWTATVDGRRQPTEMVSPALVATTVSAGTHRIGFAYDGWRHYPLLLALAAAALLALALTGMAKPCMRPGRPNKVGSVEGNAKDWRANGD